ncbi:hypothetical protein ANCCEY_06336 [Ancylostoma ceylanicum]|uniref:Uncharacterized protein n=1 Tax=Ancylostoma ceylanicum TaxID=53326 RepID=A0A0D6LR88_9BILA|nr:hypothetical protein ANCCEY_06336 [Ancylostoma ceylanicum]
MHLQTILLAVCAFFLPALAQYGSYPYQSYQYSYPSYSSSYSSYSYPSYYSRSPYGYSQYPSYYSNSYYPNYNRHPSFGLFPLFRGVGVDQYGNTYIGTRRNGIFLTCNGRGCPGRGK